MANKKNKKAKKPAVGNPAAGSNNKRDKNQSQKPKAPQKNGAQKQTKPVQNKDQKADKNIKKPAPQKEQIKKEKAVKKTQKVKPEKKVKKEKKEKKIAFDFKKFLNSFKEKFSITKIAVAAGAVIVAAVVIILILNKNIAVPDSVKNAEFKGRIENESVAFTMDISESQQEALSKETKAKGDKSAFSFFVTDNIVMNEYDDPAFIEFGSVNSNDCVLVFFILDENGNEMYRSLGVEPGKQIRSIEFFDEIPYGTHDFTIAVLGYDAKTYEKVGMQTAKITLEIGVE